jgi:hypothetical protein
MKMPLWTRSSDCFVEFRSGCGGGFVPQSLIDSSEVADSMMVGNAEKGQNGKFFIQFSFSSPRCNSSAGHWPVRGFWRCGTRCFLGSVFVGTAAGRVVGGVVAGHFEPHVFLFGVFVFLLGLLCAVIDSDRITPCGSPTGQMAPFSIALSTARVRSRTPSFDRMFET